MKTRFGKLSWSYIFLVRKIALKLEKSHGEKVILLAKRHELLDENFRIIHDEKFIFVPLKEKPSREFLNAIEKICTEIGIEKVVFERRLDRPVTLIDLLRGKLAPNVLAHLPKSIDVIGDIAVFEISPGIEKYKRAIGKALLNIDKTVKTVLIKAGPISTEYRIRDYEFIAGTRKTVTEHKEFGCKYFLDLAKVYFSPRLSFEHNRVSSDVKEGEVIVDMFAGIGPFSILLAKKVKRSKVYAIDINPEAVKFLVKNIACNKVKRKVTAIYGDAREVAIKHLQRVADRMIMNLPSESIKFIDVACKVLKPKGGILHFYTFTDNSSGLDEKIKDLQERVSSMNRKSKEIKCSRKVREIAPHKWQIVIDAEIV